MGTYAGTRLAAQIKGEETARPFRFRYVMRCISLGRKDGLVQFVGADDSPRERILTGWVGARVKELVSRSSVWNVQFEGKLASLLNRNLSSRT